MEIPLNITGSQHFLRVKVPRGFIKSEQFRRVAELIARSARIKRINSQWRKRRVIFGESEILMRKTVGSLGVCGGLRLLHLLVPEPRVVVSAV